MNSKIVRNLFGAVLALSLTGMTTLTIVHSVERPYVASDAPAVSSPSDTPARVAQCAGHGKALC
jgi:hypothetical protein